MSLSSDTRLTDRRNPTLMLSPQVALDLVLRCRPSTPAIEEARRLSLARQAQAASNAMTESLSVHPTVERSSERAIRRAGYVDTRPSAHRGNLRVSRPSSPGPRPSSPGPRPSSPSFSPSAPGPVSSPRMRPATPGAQPSVASAGDGRRTGFPAPAVASRRAGAAAALAVVPSFIEVERKAPPPSPRTRLSSVPPPSPKRPSAAITGGILGSLLLLVAFSSVGLHGKLAKNQLALDKLRADVSIEEQSNQTLRVEVAELQAPQRIVAEAERMGMEPSTEVMFLSNATGATASDTTPVGLTVPPSVPSAR